MHFRDGDIKDAAVLADVFFRSIREGSSPYTEAQRAAWLPARLSQAQFARRIGGMYVVVAEDRRRVVGFMGMMPDGCIDLAFILPEARGRGAFRHLYELIEFEAQAQALPVLRTHASLMAQPAFRAVGFSVIQQETVERGGQHLRRALMEKKLA